MKKMDIAVFGLTLAVAASGAVMASAATVRWTFTGTVSGSWSNGPFGALGSSLDGQAFKMTYLFDTTLGARQTFNQAVMDQVIGGQAFGGVANPTLSAQLTIAGHTETIIGADFSYYYVRDGSSYDPPKPNNIMGAGVVDPFWLTYRNVNVSVNVPYGTIPVNPMNLEAPFVLRNVAGSGWFVITADIQGNSQASGNLNVTKVTSQLGDVAPVPLPAAGLALIAGLGGLGLVGWRQRPVAD